ncbi:unnamed protein product [Schistosoma margrebowiei]|uniref:Trafficking protein particle complex subunit 13 middle domain-containing protein n=1 Tax=Schistosoma margrebowiei TaxID=48269 RepID=A0A3P8FHH2_9TREM|nr:unnamed protein product [Schistosoma margrebowiei]
MRHELHSSAVFIHFDMFASFLRSHSNTPTYYLQPNDVQQFLYLSSTTNRQVSISAGRLDITWRSLMGERGRLQTSSLKYEVRWMYAKQDRPNFCQKYEQRDNSIHCELNDCDTFSCITK